MAGRILLPCNPALDGDGLPRAGSKLFFYENGDVNTPKAVYLSAADADAGANPITSQIADGGGRFAQAFGPDAAKYSVVWQTAAGSQLAQFDDVEVQGTAEGIYRDLDTNGRFQVRGEGGEVQMEFGQPTGDDTGGSGRIGGWNGSQGDTLEFDFSDATFTGSVDAVEGFTEAGQPVAMVRVAGGKASGVTSLDIPLPADCELYQLVLSDVLLNTDADRIGARAGYGATPTFSTSGYAYAYTLNINGTLSAAVNGSASFIPLIWNANAAQIRTILRYNIWVWALTIDGGGFFRDNSASAQHLAQITIGGRNETNTANASAIRLLTINSSGFASTGTMTFTWTLYKIKGHVSNQTS